MTTAEKLVQIAQNEQKIYDKGFSDGKAQGGGGDSYYDTFWDSYQENGKRTNYNYAFAGRGWNNTTYNPKYKKLKPSYVTNMFSASAITDTLYPIDLTNVQSTIIAMFQGSALKKIRTLTVKETNVFASSAFESTTNLEEIEFAGTIGSNNINFGGSTKLNKQSIESIINALSSTKTGLSITLSKTAVNNAFGIDVDDLTTYPEGSEYYILRHSRDNWTIKYI